MNILGLPGIERVKNPFNKNLLEVFLEMGSLSGEFLVGFCFWMIPAIKYPCNFYNNIEGLS